MTLFLTVFAILALGVLALTFWYVPAYRRYRGEIFLRCPETRDSAIVEVNALKFTATSLFENPTLRLKDCSRWPERADCGQGCLSQLVESHEEHLGASPVARSASH